MLSYGDIALRLGIAIILGGIVGLEREYQNQPAGLRTHIILVLGAALTTIVSIDLQNSDPPLISGDIMRLSAGVITGIGFLGGGAILRFGANVKGLTTSTSMWTMAIVGIAVGAGLYFPAVITTVVVLLVLLLLNIVEDKWIQSLITLNISLQAKDKKGMLGKIKRIVGKYSVGMGRDQSTFHVEKNMKKNEITVNILVRTRRPEVFEELISELGTIDGVYNFEIT
jgi:putative Mg2+ transporter-C (MgtC) family protein